MLFKGSLGSSITLRGAVEVAVGYRHRANICIEERWVREGRRWEAKTRREVSDMEGDEVMRQCVGCCG